MSRPDPTETRAAEHDDAENPTAAAAWHQQQAEDHANAAIGHHAAGRWLLADQHRLIAAWHRDCAAHLP